MSLTPLPRGATGFLMAGEPPLPQIPAHTARGAVVAVMGPRSIRRISGGGRPHMSFHDLRVDCGHATYRVLCHRVLPWLAWADVEPEMPLRFLPIPRAIASVPEPFVLIDGSELDQPVTPRALSLLGEAELRQLAYWNPTRIGDVVFQWWD